MDRNETTLNQVLSRTHTVRPRITGLREPAMPRQPRLDTTDYAWATEHRYRHEVQHTFATYMLRIKAQGKTLEIWAPMTFDGKATCVYRPLYDGNARITSVQLAYCWGKYVKDSYLMEAFVNSPKRAPDFVAVHRTIKENCLEFELPAPSGLYAFTNGCLDVKVMKFTPWTNFTADEATVATRLFLCDFDEALLATEVHIPDFEKIIQDQSWAAETNFMFEAMLGRLGFPCGFDKWDVAPVISGTSGAGKTTIVESVLGAFYADAGDIANLPNKAQVPFELAPVYGSKVVFINDVDQIFTQSYDVKDIKNAISGEQVTINRKNMPQVTMTWDKPLVFTSNDVIAWTGKHQAPMARRLVYFNCVQKPETADTELKERLSRTDIQVKLLVRLARKYHEARIAVGSATFYDVVTTTYPQLLSNRNNVFAEADDYQAFFDGFINLHPGGDEYITFTDLRTALAQFADSIGNKKLQVKDLKNVFTSNGCKWYAQGKAAKDSALYNRLRLAGKRTTNMTQGFVQHASLAVEDDTGAGGSVAFGSTTGGGNPYQIGPNPYIDFGMGATASTFCP